jgi:putative tricarboxylic transport membrane protein
METFNYLLHGFTVALQPIHILYCFIGTLTGTLVGVLPGIGPSATLGMLLPLIYNLDPVSAIIMLAGICYGAMYGGSTTSILLNMPGEPSSVITCLDGYMMARKGRAGPALGISAFGSFIAGTFAVIGLVFLAPTLANFGLKFGPPEFFSLMVMAMMIVTYLARTSVIKALMMAVFGVMVGIVGMDPVSAKPRFTFGIADFYEGIDLVAIIMGLFGISEVLLNIGTIKKSEVFLGKITGLFPNKEDWRRSAMPIGRGTLIGFFMGLIPGVGMTIPTFISYVVEKRLSKHPERFGTGMIEGVASPEACNNAAMGGNFIPLMSLGVPSTPIMAILLAAMVIVGVTPGPLLIKTSPTLFWGVVASMYIGNIMLLILNLPLIPMWVKILKIPYSYLFSFILLFIAIGAYSLNNNVMDIFIAIAFGILGYFMNKFGYELPPFVLGLVLGPIIEVSLRRSLILSHGSFTIFMTRPISACFLIIVALLAALLLITRKHLGAGLQREE